MIFNASSADILDHGMAETGTHSAVVTQIAYAVLGSLFGCILYAIGPKNCVQYSGSILIVLSVLLLLVFVPGIGVTANGARRWIKVFGLSMQPSEFVKLAVPLYYINCFSTSLGDYRQLMKKLAWLAAPLLLILIEPNNGTLGVIVLLLFVLCFLTKIPFKLWAFPALVLVMIAGVCAVSMPYVRHRLDIFLHPEKDLKGKGHQPYQAKIASGSGGLVGVGPGKSMQKLSYLPEAQNDYIAAIYAEEYGFIGIFILVATYGFLAVIGFTVAFHTADTDGYLIAASYTFLFSFQAFLNLAVVSGLLPSTGLNLPFLSQGGSSLIANMGALGLVMSINRGNRR